MNAPTNTEKEKKKKTPWKPEKGED